jgi:hypothetical protein
VPDDSPRRDQVPSPPPAVQERGSQGCNGVVVAVGGAKGPLADEDEVPGGELADWEPAADVLGVGLPGPVLGAGGGGLTLKSVPVTTVTCEPGCTCDGSLAMMTAPLKELATAWAAANADGVFAE